MSSSFSLFRQAAIQACAIAVILAIAWPFYLSTGLPLPFPKTAFLMGALAFVMATHFQSPWWWRLIHLFFVPALWLALGFSISPHWYLLFFILLFLLYRGAFAGRIPLYLSNDEARFALDVFLREKQRTSCVFLDVGAGFANVILPLAKSLPDAQFFGIENAHATWLIARIRVFFLGKAGNAHMIFGSFWHLSLKKYDVVYAFLSPEPMAKLWEKAQKEMPKGSYFVSNSFPIPDQTPEEILVLADRRQTQLFCYALS